ncbi:RCC1 domain-containing protein [Actinokineospora sp. 24-640]
MGEVVGFLVGWALVRHQRASAGGGVGEDQADASAARLWGLIHLRFSRYPVIAELDAALRAGRVPAPYVEAVVTRLLEDACRQDSQFESRVHAAYRDAAIARSGITVSTITNSLAINSPLNTSGGFMAIQAGGDVRARYKSIQNYASDNPGMAVLIGVLLLVNLVLVSFGGVWVISRAAGTDQVAGQSVLPVGTAEDQIVPTGGTLLATGYPLACGLRENLSAHCWWEDGYLDEFAGASQTPPDRFTSISVFDSIACGLKQDQTVLCWDAPRSWVDGQPRAQPPSPSGSFVSIVVGCGIRSTGIIQCWGDDAPDAPDGNFRMLAYGSDGNACAIRDNNMITCWGRDSNAVVQNSPPVGGFTTVSVGQDHACALRVDGAITCWGENQDGQTSFPDGHYSAVATGERHSCGHRVDRTITCWGRSDNGDITPPDGEFAVLGATNSGDYSCGTRDDGTVECWGLDHDEAPARGEVFARP